MDPPCLSFCEVAISPDEEIACCTLWRLTSSKLHGICVTIFGQEGRAGRGARARLRETCAVEPEANVSHERIRRRGAKDATGAHIAAYLCEEGPSGDEGTREEKDHAASWTVSPDVKNLGNWKNRQDCFWKSGFFRPPGGLTGLLGRGRTKDDGYRFVILCASVALRVDMRGLAA